jgi:hypothetical protein
LEFLTSPARKKLLFASSDLERNEWAQIVRKYAVNSSIENVVIVTTDIGRIYSKRKNSAEYLVSICFIDSLVLFELFLVIDPMMVVPVYNRL